MLVPGIVDSDKHGSTLDVVGAYTPCDSLETAYVADNGFTTYADGVWSAVQSVHVSGLAVRSGDYLAERTEDIAILFGVSVQNFVGDALLYVSIYDTGTGTYVGTGIGETIPETEALFVRMLSADMYGKLRIRIDIIGDTVAFDSITLHSIYTYECQPDVEAPVEDCDPYWDNVVLAMHMDGTNGSTTFTDETGKTVTPDVTAVISTVDSKFGGASMTGGGLTVPYTKVNFDWWTNPYTIECWVKGSGWGNNGSVLIGNRSPTANGEYWNFGPIENDKLFFGYWNGSWVGLQSTNPIPSITTVWVHVAMTHFEGVIRLFVNGVKVAESSVAGTPQSNTSLPLSIFKGNNTVPTGYIDDLRITKGVARYTTNFTPPTAPFAENNCDTATVVLQTAATMGWSIGTEIDTSANIGWTVGWSEDYEFDKNVSLGWSLASNLDATANIGWTLQTNANAIDKSANMSWSIGQPIDKAAIARWSIGQQLDKSVAVKWTIQ